MPRPGRIDHTPASLVETIRSMQSALYSGHIREDVAQRVTSNAMDSLVDLFPGDEEGIGNAVFKLPLLEQAEVMRRWYSRERLTWRAGDVEIVAPEGQPPS